MIRGEKNKGVSYYFGDLTDYLNIQDVLADFKPDVIIHLAAQTSVAYSFTHTTEVFNVNFLGVVNMAEAARRVLPKLKRFIFSGSVEEYGIQTKFPSKETAELRAASPYGVAKLYAHWITDVYQKSYNIFTATGILFNHESPLRGLEFVSRKITNTVAEISLGLKKELVLGNLNAKRDWGYAPEYVDAIHLMLKQDKPDTFVISTGEAHSVLEFAKIAFELVGLNWKKYVKTDKRFLRPLEVDYLRGNSKKAKRKLNWKPKVTFKKLVELMLNEDLNRWKLFLDGKTFPWDAPAYPSESKIITRLSKENSSKNSLKKRKR